MSMLAVYWLFFQFGLLCFGGGYVLVPLIIANIVENPNFILDADMFGNLVAIAQMTPGPIGLNTGTFVGYLEGAGAANNIFTGIIGGIVGTAGILTPGYFLVIGASYYLKKWEKSLIVQGILGGIRPASVALILMAVMIFMGMSVFRSELPFEKWMEYLLGFAEAPEWPGFRFSGFAIMAVLEDIFCLKNIAHSINAAFKEDWERAVMDEYQKKLNYIRDRKQQQRTGR